MFGQLSDHLASAFKSLRGQGRLSPADIDRVIKDIRAALDAQNLIGQLERRRT